jgi:PKD repeat protein
MSDEPKKSKKPVAIAVVLLLCALVAGGLFLNSRRAKTPNLAPIAALRLDSIDETNRVATLSDGGSHDPDGTVQTWRIDWGDGKEETLASMPQKQAHTYASEGEYTIALWCVDNLGATSSPPAMTNITFDFLKRQRALELVQAEAKRQAEAKLEAERLKEEEARKQAERLEAERKKQMELAALEAQKAREQQEMEARRKAEAELAQQKPKEAATPPPTPLAAALPDDSSSLRVIFTPPQSTLGEFQISKEGTEGKGNDGNLLVVLIVRCVNFPDTAIPNSDWQIDGKDTHVQSSRIRASLSPGRHEVTAHFSPKAGSQPTQIRAAVTVDTTGECVVTPMK